MSDLAARPATSADLDDLLDLYLHLSPEDRPARPAEAGEILDRITAVPGSCVLIGRAQARLVTSCTLFILPNLSRRGLPYALIENVVTHADHRNKGFGKAILKAAAGIAFEAGCYKVMLMTGSRRPSTLQFYESAGFEQTKTGFQMRNLPPRTT